ncbi:hypothetical protein BH10ACI4_BH10ACI4_28330 [soil metagenome]
MYMSHRSPTVAGLSEKEMLELCRRDVEAMHNLHFLLLREEVSKDDRKDLETQMGDDLDHLTDILCRKDTA